MRRNKNRDLWGLTPPVEHVELPDVRTKRRLAAVIILGLIAVGCVGYIIWNLLTVEAGRQVISAANTESCAGDFVLMYDFESGETPLARAISRVYTEACEEAYRIFSSHKSFEGMNNLHVLSLRPNEPIKLPSELYSALELIEKYGDRSIFLAPIYDEYSSLFYSRSDAEASVFDPDRSPEQAEFIEALVKFTANPDEISLELLGDNTAKLCVSEDYLKFAEEYEIVNLVNLYRLENAFMIDYIADRLSSSGYTRGILTSFDGCVRSLGEAETIHRHYDRVGNEVFPAAMLTLERGTSLVSLRDFMLSELDDRYFYEYSDGELVTPFIDSDGHDRASISALTVFSESKGCAELLLGAQNSYISDKFDPQRLPDSYVYCEDFELAVSGEVAISELYSDSEITYRIRKP